MALTAMQQKAVEMALSLSKDANDRKEPAQVGIFSGYAGTGKTTTLQRIVDELEELGFGFDSAALLAPTGKAAQRMVETTGRRASTIHRWLYRPIENPSTGDITFTLKSVDDVARPGSGLIIVDEASMLSKDIWHDLRLMAKVLRCNILLVGDPFQLPPVQDENDPFSVFAPHFVARERVHLTEVQRQALDSPIKLASLLIREGRTNEAMQRFTTIPFEEMQATALRMVQEKGVTICLSNRLRHHLNKTVREALGYEGQALVPGEPLLITKNCYDIDRFNGEIIPFNYWEGSDPFPITVVDRYENTEIETTFRLAVVDDNKLLSLAIEGVTGEMDDRRFKPMFLAWRRAYRQRYQPYREQDEEPIPVPPFTTANYGYAMTCHKSQGSEWNSVFVIMEKMLNLYTEEGRRWLYTAVTRSKENLVVLPR